jgi:hypothetical protein
VDTCAQPCRTLRRTWTVALKMLTLREVECVVPEPCLQVALHLGQVEVGPVAARNTLTSIVEGENSKIKKGSTAQHNTASRRT